VATIRDVARRAGVSISTVSYVLTGERHIGPDTRQRVLEAVNALGYRGNFVARSLKTGRTMVLALIIPDILNPFFTLVARGAEDAAREWGYSLVLCNTTVDPDREEEYLQLAQSRRVDGLIYMPGSDRFHPELHQLVRQRFPVVVVDEQVPDVDAASIFVDNRGGGRLAGRHLGELGHRRVGIIGGPPGLSTVPARIQGVLDGLAEHGVEVPPQHIVYGDYQLESGREAMRALWRTDGPLTAIFAANDLMAIGAMQEARDWGLSVPQDISIVGFDDIPLAAMISPALTTVEQPAVIMGHAAVEVLVDALSSGEERREHRTFDTHLHVRASTAPVPGT
jgi:LacI family transcriptional regulator